MTPTWDTVCGQQRGIGLVVVVLVLLVISLLATLLMVSVNVDSKITGHGLRQAEALNVAEAGVNEALARIRSGDIDLGGDPQAVAQIFSVEPGSVPVLGTDSTGYATAQPAGSWLEYSTASRGPDVLTVQYKTDPAKTVIYRYDPALNPHVQTASGYPIFAVTSTGTCGSARRRIQVEAIQKPLIVNAKGAFVAGVGINFTGNSDICGYDHSMDTDLGDKIPACAAHHLASGSLPGAWSAGTISAGGSSVQDGNPPTLDSQTGFYSGPWDVFDMTQAEFFSWVDAPLASEPSPPTGIFYLDDNSTQQDQSGAFAYHGGDGDGLLYVDGDLTLNGTFNFRGLIYVEGDLKINGTTWILGALVVRGKTTIKIANGNCCVLYSGDAVSQNISKYGANFVRLSWREVP